MAKGGMDAEHGVPCCNAAHKTGRVLAGGSRTWPLSATSRAASRPDFGPTRTAAGSPACVRNRCHSLGRFRNFLKVSGRCRKFRGRPVGRCGCRLTPAVSFLSSSGSCRQASKKGNGPTVGPRQKRTRRAADRDKRGTGAHRLLGFRDANKQTNKQTNKPTRSLGVQLNARKEAHQEPSVATCCIVSAHVATCCTALAHGVQCRNMLHGMRQR